MGLCVSLSVCCSLVNAITIICFGCVGVHVVSGSCMQPKVVHPHGLEVRVVLVGQGWMHLMHGHSIHAGHLVLLLPLHPPVLEPDLNLALRQAQRMGDLYSAPSGQVPVEVKLFL